MRLLGTGTSPYARIVRMQILSRGLAERISVEPIATRVESSPLHAFNPTGKIPTLVLDDGTAISEARLICTYLDTLHNDTPFVHTVDTPQDRAIEGIAVGCLDGVAVWVREVRRPENERSPSILQQEAGARSDVSAGLRRMLPAYGLRTTMRCVQLQLRWTAWPFRFLSSNGATDFRR